MTRADKLGRWLGAAAALAMTGCKPTPPSETRAPESGTNSIREIASLSAQIDTLLFADVIADTTGHIVLPVGESSPFLEVLPEVFNAVVAELNEETSPVRGLRRINEASRFFEDAIAIRLDAHPDFTCGYPKTADGKSQRSGYPDLVITHTHSGAVAYLDPKLFEQTGRDSSLRSFYYEPKGETGKIHHDAHHLLVGIAHDGNDGAWQFTGWDLVDLAKFRVKLKAEFQASNRDIYREEFIVGKSVRRSPREAP